MAEPEYSEELDLVVDEIIEQYLGGEFQGAELEQVRAYFFKSDARKEQLRFAIALRERKPSPGVSTETTNVVTPMPPPRRSLTP